jgi:ribonuclease H / adenosylcobalamin/alpha-ribazole phosphatase
MSADSEPAVDDSPWTPPGDPAGPAVPGAESGVSAGAQTAPPGTWSGATGDPTRLLLVRHGQTELSVQRRYSGRGNPPLTALGVRQAMAAATRLATMDFSTVVCSPLARARQTADAVAGLAGVPVIEVPGLIEADFGAWEGLTFAEAAARDPELHRAWLSDPSVAPPDGESFEEVSARIAAIRDDLLTRYAGSTIVVVSHVTPIKTLLRLALDAGPSVLFRLHLDLASLSTAEFYPDGHSSVRLVNDTSHLALS